MALKVLAEAVLRIEHKLDVLIRHLKPQTTPMHFIGQVCPVCAAPIDYQVDMAAGVVTRKCGCKSGKLPPMYQLTPIPTEVNTNNASPKTTSSDAPVNPDSSGGRRPKDRG